ncbi:hypothetical protein FRC10_009862 [Ceratobasidium sp. 414]|nr:hypothetical protein FRC10_009862 [Ceratobasidium sp. 414]
MQPELDGLCHKSHVRVVNLDTSTETNQDDLALLISHRFNQLELDRNIGDGWPGKQLREEFEARANGNFLWAETVWNFLRTSSDPTFKLHKLLAPCNKGMSAAEQHMDKVYATILARCNWEDDGFVAECHQLMGTTVVNKVPLMIPAQRALFQGQPTASDFTLQRLSPLLPVTSLTQCSSESAPLMHQSLRDFLVNRVGSSPGYTEFQIVEKEHSQNLALLCLGILNRELHDDMSGTGYLARSQNETPGIPEINAHHMTEQLWYACQFWLEHITDVEVSSLGTIGDALEQFSNHKSIIWMELMAARGMYRGLLKAHNWAQGNLHPIAPKIMGYTKKHATACVSLATHLIYEDHREEAAHAIDEAAKLYQLRLTPKIWKKPDSVLAKSLNSGSVCLFDPTCSDEAHTPSQDAMKYRFAATDGPFSSISNLTISLDTLSVYPHFNHDLAQSLHNLSAQFLQLDRKEEVLRASQSRWVFACVLTLGPLDG